ncbi:thyrotroph embryonic factor-like isoform X1 [Artemia franciscana]|uniref:thyrotroph embryonic factor-like isoform X1 n=1 Tax=Artemia franciscana TaxID=6661 RepID=UPI0032DB8080
MEAFGYMKSGYTVYDGYNKMDRKIDPPLYMGLTLKSLLEKSDVLNTVNAALKGKADADKKDDDPWGLVDGQSAFLGPNLWDRDVFADSDLKMEYMDLDEFLYETGMPTPEEDSVDIKLPERIQLSPPNSPPSVNNDPVLANIPELPTISGLVEPVEPVYDRQVESPEEISLGSIEKATPQPKSTIRRPRKTATSIRIVDSPEPYDVDLSMSSYCSSSFDPRYTTFCDDDLKPQPLTKKSKKQVRAPKDYVPNEMKDERYWARRRKNNMAAKRSRDARRMKENQVAIRATILEKENASLKAEIERLRKENQALRSSKK